MEIKTKNNIKGDCVKANVTAVPTKGAEQGVAKRVAKKPLKKSLAKLFFKIEEIKLLLTE